MLVDYFTLQIFTPAGLVLQEDVTSVYLQAVDGQIGFLPGHARYTGLLGTGVLECTVLETGKTHRMLVEGGFCNFADFNLVILGDAVLSPQEVDRPSYAADRASLLKTVQTCSSYEAEWKEARKKLTRIEAIDALLAHPPA